MNAMVTEALLIKEHTSIAHEHVSGMNGVATMEMAITIYEPPNNVRRFIRLSNGCDKRAHGISITIEMIKLT